METMKTSIIILICSLALVAQSHAQQNRINLGGGYFGQTLAYPGFVLELESERAFSDKAALPKRLDLGFYAREIQFRTFPGCSFRFQEIL